MENILFNNVTFDRLYESVEGMYSIAMESSNLKNIVVNLKDFPRGCGATTSVLIASFRHGIPVIVGTKLQKDRYLKKFYDLFSENFYLPKCLKPNIYAICDLKDPYLRSQLRRKTNCVIIDGLTLDDKDFVSKKTLKKVIGFVYE